MRGIGTWALVAAVCVLGLAALLDAFVGGGDEAGVDRARRTTSVDERTTPAGERAALVERLRKIGASGTITYADTRCGLHLVALPSLETREAGTSPTCEFGMSPGNTWSSEPVAVYPGGGSQAKCLRAGIVELRYGRDGGLHTGPGCFPAWTPGGRLTSVVKGGLYELSEAGPDRLALDVAPILTREALARELEGTPWARSAPFVREAAWLTDDTVAVIVGGDGDVGDAIALFRNGRLVDFPLGPYPRLARLRPSPRGSYASATMVDGSGVVVADANGELVGIPIRSGQAVAWSPDETFGLIASPGGTTLFEPPTAEHAVTVVTGLPIVARDLAWD